MVPATPSSIALQSYEDSHPFEGLKSLSYFPPVQVERTVQTEADGQAVHVESATEIALQSNDDSQPLEGLSSLSYFPTTHNGSPSKLLISVHSSEVQAVHIVLVKMPLQSNDDSQPLTGSLSLSNLLLVHAEMTSQKKSLVQAVHVVEAISIFLQS
jgi:hypothetical protein